MAFAELFLVSSVSILAVAGPERAAVQGLGHPEIGLMALAYSIGLFALGPCCSYLTQKYRRNRVCLLMIALLCAIVSGMSYCSLHPLPFSHYELLYLGIIGAFCVGAVFGLAQILLCSTLVIDKCESFWRTQANHHLAWFGRIALAIGPYLACRLSAWSEWVALAGLGLAVSAIVLIGLVKFPFKTPDDDVHLFSTDRFFLTRGWRLFLCFLPVSLIMGMMVSIMHHADFYLYLFLGFSLGVIAEKWIFANAELESETVAGLIVILLALLLLLTRREMAEVYTIAPTMLGFGSGIISSRFLLFFLKLSDHCRRGTSQSTFILAWESGIGLGLGIGHGIYLGHPGGVLILGIVLTVCTLAYYLMHVHPWYLKNKAR